MCRSSCRPNNASHCPRFNRPNSQWRNSAYVRSTASNRGCSAKRALSISSSRAREFTLRIHPRGTKSLRLSYFSVRLLSATSPREMTEGGSEANWPACSVFSRSVMLSPGNLSSTRQRCSTISSIDHTPGGKTDGSLFAVERPDARMKREQNSPLRFKKARGVVKDHQS
jgi:hypothetical protein